jgi:hypothetical protein
MCVVLVLTQRFAWPLAFIQEAKHNKNKAITALLEKHGGLVNPNPKLDALVPVRRTCAFPER